MHIGLAITKTLYIVTRWLHVREDLIAKDFCLVSLQLFPILMDDSMKTKSSFGSAAAFLFRTQLQTVWLRKKTILFIGPHLISALEMQ